VAWDLPLAAQLAELHRSPLARPKAAQQAAARA
jgi:hypothetical protein